MAFFPTQGVSGDVIGLTRTHEKHLGSSLSPTNLLSGGSDSFSELLSQALHGVNQLQNEADRVSQQFITDPNSIEAHDVTIALSEANLAVSITKAIVDRALRAYSDIISIR